LDVVRMEKMASLSGVGETKGEVTTDHDVSVSVSVSVSCATEALARSSNVGMVMEASMTMDVGALQEEVCWKA
jgi:hypothetical protein